MCVGIIEISMDLSSTALPSIFIHVQFISYPDGYFVDMIQDEDTTDLNESWTLSDCTLLIELQFRDEVDVCFFSVATVFVSGTMYVSSHPRLDTSRNQGCLRFRFPRDRRSLW